MSLLITGLFQAAPAVPPPTPGDLAAVLQWWTSMWNPYTDAVAITKSDTDNFIPGVAQSGGHPTCEAIYVGGAGIVAAVFQNGRVVNFTAAAGEILPIRCIRVNSTDTTATLMVALYSV